MNVFIQFIGSVSFPVWREKLGNASNTVRKFLVDLQMYVYCHWTVLRMIIGSRLMHRRRYSLLLAYGCIFAKITAESHTSSLLLTGANLESLLALASHLALAVTPVRCGFSPWATKITLCLIALNWQFIDTNKINSECKRWHHLIGAHTCRII